MAGAMLEVSVQDRAVRAALERLSRSVLDLRPAFRDAGEALLNSHRQRFTDQRDPDGKPWAPLSPAYRARKTRNKDLILVLRGYLKDTLRPQVSSTRLELGTDRVYGATHQFGDPKRNIPARPFLGLSGTDRQTVLSILSRHLRQAVGG